MTECYQFEVHDREGYDALAEFASKLDSEVSLFPALKTVAVGEIAQEQITDFLEDEEIEFECTIINEVIGAETLLTDPCMSTALLRSLASEFKKKTEEAEVDVSYISAERDNLKKQLEQHDKVEEDFFHYWQEAKRKNEALKSRLEALSVLMSSLIEQA